MKNGRSITELAMELERQKSTKKDYVASTNALELQDDGEVLTIEGQGNYPVRDLAHSQIASKLNIPKKYYDMMRVDAPDLLATNVNRWFNQKGERRMIRTMDGEARAFLSQRYRPLDNYELAEAVLPTIQEMDCQVMSCEVTDTHLYLKCVTERITHEITKGDIVQAGICISNSEVGLSSLKIEPLIYRLVCTNGMIANDFAMRKYHVGRRNGDDGQDVERFYTDETRQLDDAAFWHKARDLTRAAMNEVQFKQICSKMQEATEVQIEADLVKVIDLTADKFGLNETEKSGVLQHLIKGGDLSQYGLSNAITRTSQDVAEYNRATDLERMGGDIITLSPTDWKAINAA